MNEDRSNPFTSFSLLRRVILRGKFFFDRLFQQGHSLHTPSLHLKFVLLDQQPSEFRVAFITPKRLGKAVVRNKARRRMREAFRLNQHSFVTVFDLFHTGVHCALISKKASLSFQEYVSDINALSEKMNHYLTIKNSKQRG